VGSLEPPPDAPAPVPVSLDSTTLIRMAKAGDRIACNLLVKKHMPALRRWAHGRLPRRARDLIDTDDLVQVTMVRALEHMGTFEHRRSGAFFAYLRQILLNHIRDEIRRISRRPGRDGLSDDIADGGPSPLDEVVGREARERYERALARLPAEPQQAVMLRLELGFHYDEIAEALGRPTENAARLLVTRAVKRLAREMHERGPGR
jgi:RNA polymerase sigma-70 factor (ECF subfamily)